MWIREQVVVEKRTCFSVLSFDSLSLSSLSLTFVWVSYSEV